MNNQRYGCLGIILVVVLGLSLLFNFVFLFSGRPSIATTEELPKLEHSLLVPGAKGSEDKIVVLYLRGLISGSELGAFSDTMVDDLKLQLQQAADDAHIKAIVLNIDSPGGEVTASDTIYNAVRRARAKKPVVVYMGSLAASGGYYVACGAKWLIANETTFTGSIGVIMQSLNYQELFGKVGLASVVFKSGKMKDMLSGSRQLTDEEKEYVQGMIMQTYGKFVGIVAKERNLPEDQLRNGLADGRVISGKDALAAKLIDQVGEIEDAYDKAKELGKAPGAAIVTYQAPFKLGKIFRLLGKTDARQSSKVQVELTPGIMPHLEVGRLYFLPSIYAP